MKRFTFYIIATLLVTISVAQDFRVQRRREYHPEDIAKWQTAQMQKALQLDSIQYQAIFLMNYADAVAMQDSIKARRERMEKMRAEGKTPQRPTEEQMRERRKIREEREQIRNDHIRKILTPEQYDKYIRYCEEQRDKMRHRAPGRHR